MVSRQVRSLFLIDNTMRILLCLIMTCSVLATDSQAQTTNNSQAAAVAAIKKLGGKVTFDKKNPGKPIVRDYLRGHNVTDAGLVHLKGPTKLQRLNLSGTEVTDAGLVHLKGLRNLRSL
jgi:hypothetical protein